MSAPADHARSGMNAMTVKCVRSSASRMSVAESTRPPNVLISTRMAAAPAASASATARRTNTAKPSSMVPSIGTTCTAGTAPDGACAAPAAPAKSAARTAIHSMPGRRSPMVMGIPFHQPVRGRGQRWAAEQAAAQQFAKPPGPSCRFGCPFHRMPRWGAGVCPVGAPAAADKNGETRQAPPRPCHGCLPALAPGRLRLLLAAHARLVVMLALAQFALNAFFALNLPETAQSPVQTLVLANSHLGHRGLPPSPGKVHRGPLRESSQGRSAQQVKVQVKHPLPAVRTAVVHDPIARLLDVKLPGQDVGHLENVPQKLRVVIRHVGQRRYVPPRNDEEMNGRLRIDIAKRDDAVVFID